MTIVKTRTNLETQNWSKIGQSNGGIDKQCGYAGRLRPVAQWTRPYLFGVLARPRPFGLRLLDARRYQHGGRQYCRKSLEFAEGSRKNKVVSLTEEGRRFAERYALPALKAEQRAFGALEPCEQREIMRLIGKFSHALGDECDAFKQHIAAESQAENQGEGESCDC